MRVHVHPAWAAVAAAPAALGHHSIAGVYDGYRQLTLEATVTEFQTQTLKPGDRIVVIGNPGRDMDDVLYVRKLERPADGFNYAHHPTPFRQR